MQLKINGENIDYTLEKEEVLSEVVSGIEDWLGGAGLLITGIRMGERELPTSHQMEWGSTPIASVAELDFRVSHPKDVRIEHWVTVRAWLGILTEDLSGSGDSMDDLLESLPATLEGLKKNPFLPPGSKAIDSLGALFGGQTAAQVREWPEDRRREARAIMEQMREALGKRVEEALHPQETMRGCIGELRGTIGRITEVSVLLQTGKDKQAMEIIVGFSEIIQRLISIVPFLPKDEQREKLFEELNPVLRELVSAFDARDLVLIGDLFEYEISPRLERLLPLLEKSV